MPRKWCVGGGVCVVETKPNKIKNRLDDILYLLFTIILVTNEKKQKLKYPSHSPCSPVQTNKQELKAGSKRNSHRK